MAEERDVRPEDEKDKGVKIEIHGEDDPKEDLPEETMAEETEKAGTEGDPAEKPEDPVTETSDDSDEKADDAQPEGKDAEDAESSESTETGDNGAGADSGKGFFGFKKKKDKKDEKIEQLTDQVARQLAEFDNYRKRTDREKAAMFDMGRRDVVEKILPVVDNFERGLGDIDKEDDDPFRQGMIRIYRQLMKVLDDMGVRAIEAEGKPFDPNIHNAVMHCEDDKVGENIVVQDLQKGYTMNDTVIRHSMVKVAN